MKQLWGNVASMDYWGFSSGEWWEIGSGSWTARDNSLRCEKGKDPEWTWISSPCQLPDVFAFTCSISGKAELVGIGFGVQKDFLVPKQKNADHLSFRFVLDRSSFELYIDGVASAFSRRSIKNIEGVESLRKGRLQLKVLNQQGPVIFSQIFVGPIVA